MAADRMSAKTLGFLGRLEIHSSERSERHGKLLESLTNVSLDRSSRQVIHNLQDDKWLRYS